MVGFAVAQPTLLASCRCYRRSEGVSWTDHLCPPGNEAGDGDGGGRGVGACISLALTTTLLQPHSRRLRQRMGGCRNGGGKSRREAVQPLAPKQQRPNSVRRRERAKRRPCVPPEQREQHPVAPHPGLACRLASELLQTHSCRVALPRLAR